MTTAPTSTHAALSATGPATRCWTLQGADGPVDVEIDAADENSLSDVLPALRAVLGVPFDGLWAGSTRLSHQLSMRAAALRHGATLGVDRPGPGSPREDSSSALELRAVGGPDAGRVLPLAQGRHVVGRGVTAGIALEDPDVSRRHVEVCVRGGTVSVRDLGSTNGSRLDGEELGGTPTEWPGAATLCLGGTTLALGGATGAPATGEPGRDGRWHLRPPVRLTTPAVEVEVALPVPPSAPVPRRLPWAAVALPAVGGVLLAALLRTPSFLFFALLGPVVAVGSWWSERRSAGRAGRRELARYTADLAATHRRVGEAVAAFARGARSRHPDLAELVAAAGRRSSLLWSRRVQDGDALVVRLGTGPGATGVRCRHPDGRRVAERTDGLPITVDLRRSGGLVVTGPRERALGVLRSVIAQLTALHPPGTVDLVLLVEAARRCDWRWVRWVPHLPPHAVTVLEGGRQSVRAEERVRAALAATVDRIRTDVSTAAAGGPVAPSSWQVVVLDGPVTVATAAALRDARAAGVLVLTHAGSLEAAPVPVDAALRLGGETGDCGLLVRDDDAGRVELTVDRLAEDVAAELARDLADLQPAAVRATLPTRVRLLDLERPGVGLDAAGRAVGPWSSRARDHLVTPLGTGPDGPFTVDLCRLGPHALVAGTTGSGKSELLQSLIAGLALAHPPDRCSFLLVDYKGGAAFAEAAELPHTVGMLTDLDGATTARALQSLTAELVRRETLLARAGAADVAALPDDVDLARLVIVVDEFATLAEELPSFVPGLVAIAQRGRSLGVHLVLATQRPGGVVSPEIRANCTLRICLRTTDEADSRDVLGTAAAAHLPIDIPGRALVRSGAGVPTVIQVARVSQPAPAAAGREPRAREWAWPVSSLAQDFPSAPSGDTELAQVARALRSLAEVSRIALPHRPWLPPLAETVTVADVTTDLQCPPEVLTIGLLDHPERQAQEPLVLDLRRGGGWLAVGGPRSGRTTLLRTVLRVAAGRSEPERVHVHVIDLGGGSLAAEADELPHTGTAVGRLDALRTVRLVDRLTREVARRRAGGHVAGDLPLLLLLVDGVEALTALLDDGDPGRGSGAFLQLVRDGAAAGLTCVLTADRAMPGGRLAAVAAQRLVLPLADRADYAVAGVPMAAVPPARPPGRALVGETAVACQLAVADAIPPGRGRSRRPSAHAPVRVIELPADPALPLPAPGSHTGVLLPVGPGGDEGAPLCLDLARTGGLLVVGPPGSGRSSALRAFATHLAAAGVPVLEIGPPRHPTDGAGPSRAACGDAAAVRTWMDRLGGRLGVVCADDLAAPAEAQALGALAADSRIALIAAGGPGQLSAHFQGPVSALRRSRTGLLLCPGPAEADVLGLRLPRTPLPERPGSGWLITAGVADRVQVARHRTGAGSAPGRRDRTQSSSRTGPISCVAYQASS